MDKIPNIFKNTESYYRVIDWYSSLAAVGNCLDDIPGAI